MYVISYSGGVQSTALLALAVQRRITSGSPVVVNVDLMHAEDPRTRQYVIETAMPFCAKNGIRFVRVEVDAVGDLLNNPAHPKAPFRTEAGGFIVRQCTNHWKIRPFRRVLRALMKEYGIRLRRDLVSVALGISIDELDRMTQPNVAYYQHVYPLIDLRLTRTDCVRVIQDSGLPVPGKSACWFCPYTAKSRVQEIAHAFPEIERELFRLDATINDARARASLPRLVIAPDGSGAACGGYCMT